MAVIEILVSRLRMTALLLSFLKFNTTEGWALGAVERRGSDNH